MFKDDYRKEIEDIRLNDDAKVCIKNTLSNVEGGRKKTKNPAVPWRVGFAVTAAVAIVLTVAFGNIGKNASKPEVIVDKRDGLLSQKSYDGIYSILDEIRNSRADKEVFYEYVEEAYDTGATNGTVTGGGAPKSSENKSTSTNEYSATDDSSVQLQSEDEKYSDTTTQVEGVAEADIVKTDGKYIYSLTDNTVRVVEANSGSPRLVQTISLPDEGERNYFEMYLSGDRLVIVGSVYTRFGSSIVTDKMATMDMVVLDSNTEILVYDVSTPSSAELIGKCSQSGNYNSSRMIGGIVYAISNHPIRLNDMQKDCPESFVPTTGDGNESAAIAPECVWSPIEGTQDATYLVACSIDSENAEFLSTISVLGSADTVYSSKNNIITAAARYDRNAQDKNYTSVSRFSLNDGKIEYVTTGMVVGNLIDQFSIDEHNGYFRFVTTAEKYELVKKNNDDVESGSVSSYVGDGESTASYTTGSGNPVVSKKKVSSYETYTVTTVNGLYVLDSSLKPVGSVDGLAKGERVYSVRFMGDTAYFVTFKQVDPLFSVDLSDPENPKVIGELKIPGFSEYLYPYGDGLLLGIGQEVEPDTLKIKGLKLSMFDISDPSNVGEKDKNVLDFAIYSEALYSHKACIVHSEKNLIGFAVNGKLANTKGDTYVLYTYDNGFKEILRVENDDFLPKRGLFIGDVFYIVGQRSVKAFSLETLLEIGKLSF